MKREKKDFSFVIVSEISLKKPHWILNFCFLEKGKKKWVNQKWIEYLFKCLKKMHFIVAVNKLIERQKHESQTKI